MPKKTRLRASLQDQMNGLIPKEQQNLKGEPRVEESQFQQISTKLDSILKLLALNTVQGRSLRDQVALLSSVGFQPKQIAEMLGKTPNHISVVLHDIRRKQQAENEAPQPNAVPEGGQNP